MLDVHILLTVARFNPVTKDIGHSEDAHSQLEKYYIGKLKVRQKINTQQEGIVG
jgi:hypothetical protein